MHLIIWKQVSELKDQYLNSAKEEENKLWANFFTTILQKGTTYDHFNQ